MNTQSNNIRFDLRIIASWIEPESKVLDLGCGEGELLLYLKNNYQVNGAGIDQKEENVAVCIEKKLSVIQGDINTEVKDYPAQAFDYVILSQTLQQVYHPSELLQTLLHIGRKVIVSFPNFSHFSSRFQLFFGGIAPVTDQLPYKWYDTPNIRVITLKDFRRYIRRMNLKIVEEAAISTRSQKQKGKRIFLFKNLMATYGIYLIEKNSKTIMMNSSFILSITIFVYGLLYFKKNFLVLTDFVF